MIVEAIEAHNFRRFRRLSLTHVPGDGVVALVGDNETGKSTLGEAICFALFGRTETLEADRAIELVRWDAVEMSLQLDFSSRGKRYRVFRRIDIEGQEETRLICHDDGGEPTVGGPAVAAAMRRVLGFDYEHYRDSLYLTQSGEGHEGRPETIQQMVGLDDLDSVRTELSAELVQHEAEETQLRARIDELRQAVDGLDAEPEKLREMDDSRSEQQARLEVIGSNAERQAAVQASRDASLGGLKQAEAAARPLSGQRPASELASGLEQVRTAVAALRDQEDDEAMTPEVRDDLSGRLDRLAGAGQKLSELRDRAQSYREDIAGRIGDESADGTLRQRHGDLQRSVRKVGGKRARSSLLGWLCLLAGLAFGAGWGVLKFAPGSGAADTLLRDVPVQLTDNEGMPLGAIGGGLGLVGVIALLMSGSRRRQLVAARSELDGVASERQALENDLKVLDEAEGGSVGQWLEQVQGVSDESLGGELRQFVEQDGAVLAGDRLDGELGELQKALGQAGEQLQSSRDASARATSELESEQAAGRETLASLEADREALASRIQEREGLLAGIAEEEAKLAELSETIAGERVAIEVLHETSRRMKRRALLALKNFVSRVLPQLTDSRYQHFRVDEEDLSVRVFSADKQNFMSLEELSRGTYSQLVLGMRLALAEALVSTCGAAPQMIFLDEPFAHWDRHRTRGLLGALGTVSPLVTQFLIATQDNGPTAGFTAQVTLVRDAEELVVDCSELPAPADADAPAEGETETAEEA